MAAYIIFVTDTADIVRGAKFFMWSNFGRHGNFLLSRETKLLYLTSNLAPHDSNFVMWVNDKLFFKRHFAAHDKFTIYAVL